MKLAIEGKLDLKGLLSESAIYGVVTISGLLVGALLTAALGVVLILLKAWIH